MTDTLTISDLSVSRVKTADKCMRAYEYQYVRKIPAAQERAAKIFGTVVHNGVEHWYGGDYQNEPLKKYVDAQWWEVLPQDIAIALRHCITAELGLDELAQLIAISRPKIKAARQTKDFLSSEQFGRFEDARDELLAAASKCEDLAWAKDENAFQAYVKSMRIADQLEARWKLRPRPLVVEREFGVPFGGLHIKGRIDQIRIDPDPQGQVAVEGFDLKTGRQLMTQMDAFLQAFLYNEACHLDPDLPVPDYWTFWMARLNQPQHARIDRNRHAPLAEKILHSVKRRIEAQDYAPQYGMWCKSCDFKELCETELSIWNPGEDSIVLEGFAA